MLIKMAWLNIWRNPRRTVILLCSVIVGLVGVIFIMGFINSWLDSLLNKAVDSYAGHVKILGTGHRNNPIIERHLRTTPAMQEWLKAEPRITAWAERLSVQGLISSAHRSSGARIIGIDPEDEKRVSSIAKHMQEGSFLTAEKKNRILIGKTLARKFKVRLKSRVVILSQQLGGEIGSGAFKVVGIFDTGSAGFDESNVYILKSDAQRMLNMEGRITEIVSVLDDINQSEQVVGAARAALGNDESLEIVSWKELLPFVTKNMEMTDGTMIVVYAVFYMAMAFGILNTLLMSIGERTYEFGVMMAIGTKRSMIIAMILLESACVAAMATVMGIVIGLGLVGFFGRSGIDLSGFAEAMDYVQAENILYPYIHANDLLAAALSTFLVALLFSIYPAFKASRMVPVDALRQVG